HEAPVGPVGERRPHLLATDDPLVAVPRGPGGHVGEVAAGVRLGVALAPQLGAGDDPRQEASLLIRGAEGDEGRPEQVLTDVAETPRAPRPGVLLVEDHLLAEVEAAAAVLRW